MNAALSKGAGSFIAHAMYYGRKAGLARGTEAAVLVVGSVKIAPAGTVAGAEGPLSPSQASGGFALAARSGARPGIATGSDLHTRTHTRTRTHTHARTHETGQVLCIQVQVH